MDGTRGNAILSGSAFFRALLVKSVDINILLYAAASVRGKKGRAVIIRAWLTGMYSLGYEAIKTSLRCRIGTACRRTTSRIKYYLDGR